MKRAAILVAIALVSAVAGYVAGFRSAWSLGLMADAPVRGSIALVQLGLLEKGRTEDLRTGLEADIDSGLLRWSELESHPTSSLINQLSGQDVIPRNEKFVRRLAVYRKSHPSPMSDPRVINEMLSAAEDADPAWAAELEAGGKGAEAAMARMIQKYGD